MSALDIQYGKNKYGLDVAHFRKELRSLSDSLPDRTPDEFMLYLNCLAQDIESRERELNKKQFSQRDLDLQREHNSGVKKELEPKSESYIHTDGIGDFSNDDWSGDD